MRALVIGAGSIGARRARILKSLGVEVYICDSNTERLNNLTRELHLSGFGSIDMAANYQFDVALICTPPSTHLDIGLRVAGAGCHLFIEKPLSNFLDKKKIIQLVYKMQVNGLIGIIGQSYRFCPSLVEFNKQLDRCVVVGGWMNSGQHLSQWSPDYANSIYANPVEGGIVTTSLAHSLDTVQFVFGGIEAVSGLIANSHLLGIDVPDMATLLLRMKSGAQVMLHDDFLQRPRRTEIGAIAGGLSDLFESNTARWNFGPAEAEAMYLAETKHLVDCIQNKHQCQPDLSQGILNLEWMEACRLASNTGTWQRIDEFWKEATGRK